MKLFVILIMILLTGMPAYPLKWEELDKAPEGAHQGQMLIGAYATFGLPLGTIINNERGFVSYTTYTFHDSFVSKFIMLIHYAISYGLFFEYMPIDYLGGKIKVRSSSIMQSTKFGSDYRNWSMLLYRDYALYVGPAVHFPMRRNWDVSLTPFVGYAFGKYVATPIASRLVYGEPYNLNDYITSIGSAETANKVFSYKYLGNRKQVVNNLGIGAELNVTLYISGGLFISFGFDWIMNMLKFGEKFYLNNLTSNSIYRLKSFRFYGNTNSSPLHTISFILSAGYAVSN